MSSGHRCHRDRLGGDTHLLALVSQLPAWHLAQAESQ